MTLGYFRQLLSSQLDSQPTLQRLKLKTAAFPAQTAIASPNKETLRIDGEKTIVKPQNYPNNTSEIKCGEFDISVKK
jgi:hypothetical protein